MTEARRHDTLALALLTLVTTLLFADVFAGRHFYTRDLTSQHYPTKHVVREIVQGGEFPYWIRHYSAGQPLAANPGYQVFYPLTWLILLPSYDLGLRLLILVHIYIGLFAMYSLLRSMAMRAGAAAVGAFSFALGALYLSFINLLPFLFCAAWLPATCLFARRYFISRSRRDFALAALFLGLQLLTGELAIVVQTGLLLGIYAVHRGIRDGGARSVARNVAAVGLICIASLALSAVQTVPAIDHLRDSVRKREITFFEATQWSMPFVRLAELVYPDLLGHAADDRVGVYWGNSLYDPGPRLPFYYGLYPGLVVSAAAAAGFLLRRRGAGLAGAIVTVSVLLAAGSHTPLYAALHAAGFTRYVRHPEKFIVLAIFAVIVFGSRVIDDLLAADERVRRRMMVIVAVVAFLAFAAAMLTNEPLFRTIWKFPHAVEVPAMVELSRRGWLLAAARAILLLLALLMTRLRPAFALPVLSAFVVLDLAPMGFTIAPRVPAAYFDPPDVVRRFPADRDDFRVFHHAAWGIDVNNRRLYFDRRAERHWVLRNAVSPNATAAYGLHTVIQLDQDRTNLLSTADFVDAVWLLSGKNARGWIDTVAAMSNVRWLGIFRPFARAVAEARGDFTKIQPVQFLEGRGYPRYYFATDVVTIRDPQDFVQKLASNAFGKQTAFVAEHAFKPSPGTVRGWTETANTARIEVESAGRGFLVISVTPHKYWRVTIDRAPARAIVTNVGYQGVIVPPGRHVVEMRYRNPRIAGGAAISVLGLIGLAVVARRR